MNIPESLNRSFLDFEQMMKEQHVFRNPNRDPIGKGKKGARQSAKGRQSALGKAMWARGKAKRRTRIKLSARIMLLRRTLARHGVVQ